MYQKMNGTESKSKTRLYNIWKMMRKRCNNPNRSDYKYYGGKGVKVCGEWNSPDGYDNFRKWALKNGYKEFLTLDRIDPDGDYCPENCRWVTRYAQSINRTNCQKKTDIPMNVKTITYKGETMTLTGWSKKLGIKRETLRKRLDMGWTSKKIIETPVDVKFSNMSKCKICNFSA